MGALLSCLSDPAESRSRPSRPIPSAPPPLARTKSRKSRRDDHPPSLTREEKAMASAAALLLQQNGISLPFDRSSSHRYPPPSGHKKQDLPRSSSTGARSLTAPLVPLQELVKQDLKVGDLETNHFVLVHGGGFGAWCWYKTIAHLEDCGFKVSAIDLTGSGIESSDTNKITSLAQYVKPLTNFMEKLNDGEKLILVGHDFGGTCISYAMEMFPSKVAKAVFVSAAMPVDGQSTLDVFSQQAGTDDLMGQAQIFLYANGNNNPPTAIDLNKSLLKDLLFNQSPVKDVALASVSMRPIPFAPVLEKLSLTEKKYGSVRRFYIETAEDNAVPLSVQQNMCGLSPPEKILRLKGADHSPFFSKPQALHKLLVEIAKAPSAKLQ